MEHGKINKKKQNVIEKPNLTVSELDTQINKYKSKKTELVHYIKNLTKQYNIPSTDSNVAMMNNNNNSSILSQPTQDSSKKCSDEYSEYYIVNDSKKRFKHEIQNSHFLAHWGDLCQYPEIAGRLRFIYSLINIKKDTLVNLLDYVSRKIDQKTIILETDNLESNNSNDNITLNKYYYQKLVNYMGLKDDISRIKIEHKNKFFNKKSKRNDYSGNNNSVNNAGTYNLIDNLNNQTQHKKVYSEGNFNRKMQINMSLIINLERQYPRNLLACPVDKVMIGERHARFKNHTLNFLCHKDNMIERLTSDKLCLSIWLIKSYRKNKWVTSLKMGTAYLSETFPGEKKNVNSFIKEILNIGYDEDAAKFLSKLEEGIKNNYFYAIETNNPKFKNPKSTINNNLDLDANIKKTKKKLKIMTAPLLSD